MNAIREQPHGCFSICDITAMFMKSEFHLRFNLGFITSSGNLILSWPRVHSRPLCHSRHLRFFESENRTCHLVAASWVIIWFFLFVQQSKFWYFITCGNDFCLLFYFLLLLVAIGKQPKCMPCSSFVIFLSDGNQLVLF